VLTGRTDSQALLAHLDQSNLFVVPMDDRRYWYRYHRLFADFLRTRVPGAQVTDLASGHSRAATWYEQHGFADEAVFHALAGRDFGAAVRVIEREGGPMLNTGRLPVSRRQGAH
jgi:LuxR family maltose regulon positive regulatory protein